MTDKTARLFHDRTGRLRQYIMLDDDYFSAEAKEHFKQKYIEPAGVELIDELPCSYEKSVRAGRALLIY